MKQHPVAEDFGKDYYTPNNGKSGYCNPFDWAHEGAERIKQAKMLVDISHPAKALDIGCANGMLVKALNMFAVEAWGVDISKWAIDNAEPEIKHRCIELDVRSNKLPFANESFDLVCSMGTLEHIEADLLDFVISEIARVTRRWIYISVPVTNSYLDKPWGDTTHVTFKPCSWWISLFNNHDCLLDFRYSHQLFAFPSYSGELTFVKGRLGQ